MKAESQEKASVVSFPQINIHRHVLAESSNKMLWEMLKLKWYMYMIHYTKRGRVFSCQKYFQSQREYCCTKPQFNQSQNRLISTALCFTETFCKYQICLTACFFYIAMRAPFHTLWIKSVHHVRLKL